MVALLWQTVALLLAAYFGGAILGCVARRLIGVRDDMRPAAYTPSAEALVPPVRRPDPAPFASQLQPAPADPQSAARFERALTTAPAEVAVPPPSQPAPAPMPAEVPAPVPPPPGAAEPVRPAAPDTTATAAAIAAAAAAVAARPPAPQPTPIRLPAAAGAIGASAVSAPLAVPQADDLTRIRGIEPALAARLNALSIARFADIAAWGPADVARLASALDLGNRIARENWIEQAQILAKGGETAFTRAARTAPPNVDSPKAAVMPAPPAERKPLGAATAAVMPAAAVVPARENLQLVAGINAEVEKLLNVQGVGRFRQIADWSAEDVARFDRLLGYDGRIARENWIEQAGILANGGETPHSREVVRRAAAPDVARPTRLADAIRETAAKVDPAAPVARPVISTLRSVRSEAYRGAAGENGGAPDDLKRIRGVGVLIEKRLNSLGVTSYEQIANWTREDVARVSETLDFKGRIERESWVEQARILASGGTTEFSRRVDRGA